MFTVKVFMVSRGLCFNYKFSLPSLLAVRAMRTGLNYTFSNRGLMTPSKGSSLEEAIVSLERGLLPRPTVGYLIELMIKCMNTQNNIAFHQAQRIHSYISQQGFESDPSLGNFSVSMLAETGNLIIAHNVFDRLLDKGERAWCSLINGYIKYGNLKKALTLYAEMKVHGSNPSGHTLVALIKSCTKLKDVEKGKDVYAYVLNSRKGLLESNRFLGTALVDMFAKFGMLRRAREVFEKIQVRDLALWNALISGYAQHGEGEEALRCFEDMLSKPLSPNAITFVSCLKACGSIRHINKGIEIHEKIMNTGLLECNQIVGNAVIDMYAKCGLISKAQEVFDSLPVKNIVSWNALITGYVQHKMNKEALDILAIMKDNRVPPDAITFASLLKACSSLGDLQKGEQMHAEINRNGLSQDYLVGNALVDFYVKIGMMEKSEEVFDSLSVRDVVTWGTMIAGYARHKNSDEALKCHERMKFEGVPPDANTFISSLKACAAIGDIQKGEEIYSEIIKETLLRENQSIGAALIDMYAKCGFFKKAHLVLKMLPERNAVAWTALIAGYVQHECWVEALNCFQQMELEGVTPDVITWVCVLQACGSSGDIGKGSEIHATIERKALLESNLVLGTNLVDMYAKCGMLVKACQVLYKLSVPDAASWNALISGYVQYEYNEEALDCSDLMQSQGLSLNHVTFACTLKACCNIGDMLRGQEIHAEIARKGVLNSSDFVDNALIDLYAKCSSFAKAKEVFDMLEVKSTISWNALISGCVQNDCGEEALRCFEEMQVKGVSPDDITISCILKACGRMGIIEKGEQIHADIESKGLVESNVMVGTALLDMYAKCGMLEKSQQVFDKITAHNTVSWTALIAGYTQHGYNEDALGCFNKMVSYGISPNANTFVCILKACGNSGSTEKGNEIYAQVEQNGLVQSNQIIGNASIDMYAKFGMLAKAQEVFEKLPAHDVISWNSLLAGYSQWGSVSDVLHYFERMREDIKPNSVTFLTVLNACSHAGLLDKGQSYYEAMSEEYGITALVEHNTCIIDLFGRAAQLERAVEIMKRTSSHPNIEMWLTILTACQKWRNVELARQAFKHIMQIDDKETSAYTCMYNIYIDSCMQEDAKKLEDMMKRQNI